VHFATNSGTIAAVRLFLAIELPDTMRHHLALMQERLQATGADVRWTPLEHLHLTVHFLGDLTNDTYSEVEESCEMAADGPAFRFRAGGGSYFPKKGPPKTLWVGLTEGADAWKALVTRTETPFALMGVPKNAGLVPHITLGRVKSETNIALLTDAMKTEATTDCGEAEATEITLIESFLLPTGAVHEKRRSWALQN
jgi:RNA 2',3'-cyclic 3'-phosphodiesterase